ncbi:MAG: hypothetical protein LQ342_004100 [Letrouitia transgressa]|nr:MAG: hypothetical protein LQ342_004100 [Letrouitia transgressa]
MSNSYIESHSTTAALEAHERTLAAISKKNAELAGRNEALKRKVDALTARTTALETRLRAVQNNALSRHLNSLIPHSSHQTLHPLHALATDEPIRGFPRKITDIRTMSQGDVVHVLKALEADVTREVSGGSRKERLREVLGVKMED